MPRYRFFLWADGALIAAFELPHNDTAAAHATAMKILLLNPPCDRVEIWMNKQWLEVLCRGLLEAPRTIFLEDRLNFAVALEAIGSEVH